MNSTPQFSRRDVTVLAALSVATLLASVGQIVLATLSGIVGAQLAPSPQVATLPLAAVVVGVALSTLPVSLLIQRWGRRSVFIAGLVWASAGALLSAYAITTASFVLFCAGSFMLGGNMAVVAQYRFAAADCVPVALISRALAALMLGTLGAALLTPSLTLYYRDLLAVEFSGSFVVLPGVFLGAAVIFAGVPLERRRAQTAPADVSSIDNIAPEQAARAEFSQPNKPFDLGAALRRVDVQLAIIAATAGFGVMTLLMTATPVSMHIMDGHSVAATADVIRSHMLAMYAPSLFSGWLIARVGLRRMMWAGLALEAAAIATALSGQDIVHYRTALLLLGAGWNLLFLSGTTLLATTVTGTGATRLQGANEVIMFGTMALCSLSAGAWLYAVGWFGLNSFAALLLAALAVALWRARSLALPR